jgi:hypothetical protein
VQCPCQNVRAVWRSRWAGVAIPNVSGAECESSCGIARSALAGFSAGELGLCADGTVTSITVGETEQAVTAPNDLRGDETSDLRAAQERGSS